MFISPEDKSSVKSLDETVPPELFLEYIPTELAFEPLVTVPEFTIEVFPSPKVWLTPSALYDVA